MYRSFVKDRTQAWNAADDAPIDAASGLIQLSGLVQFLYARISERHDLTPVQARLLCMLAEGPNGNGRNSLGASVWKRLRSLASWTESSAAAWPSERRCTATGAHGM
jgi:hypothetical protein